MRNLLLQHQPTYQGYVMFLRYRSSEWSESPGSIYAKVSLLKLASSCLSNFPYSATARYRASISPCASIISAWACNRESLTCERACRFLVLVVASRRDWRKLATRLLRAVMILVSVLLSAAGNTGSCLFAGIWGSGLRLGTLGSSLPLAGVEALIL